MPMPRRLPLNLVCYAGMFIFGIVMALVGAVLPEKSVNLGQSGTLFLVMNLCMLLCSFGLGPLMDRFGLKPPLLVGPLLVGAALMVVAAGNSYGSLLAAVGLLGTGGGALNGATNTLIADLNPDEKRKNSALNLLGVFFGFGALFLPFSIGALVERLGLPRILEITAALCIGCGVYAALLAFPPPKQAGRMRAADMVRLLRTPLVLAFGFLLFFESGNEFILGGYLSSYLMRETGTQFGAASYVLAAFWAAVMVARALLSRVLLRVPGRRLMPWCALVSAAAAAALARASGLGTAAPAVILLGVALAGIYPMVLGLAGSCFAEYSGTVFGILFTIALAGGMLLPWTVGQIANAAGLRWGLSVVVVDFVAIGVLAMRATRRWSVSSGNIRP
jgi:MFS transporter, FHS family, glucose/mannose:H+ symporter